jgi:predicted DNA-binding transcriptional regulator YafY
MPDAPIQPERIARALTLLSYLLDEERDDRVPLADVLRDLGVSRKQVQEDLSLLNLVNHGGGTYVIYGEMEGDTVHVTREPAGETMASPARLSPLMARALLLAVDLVGDKLPVDGRRTLASIRGKVTAAFEGVESPKRVEIEPTAPSAPDIMEVVNRGLRDRRLVEIEYYTASRDELTSRLIEPYLIFDARGAWYLEAYCRRASAQRTFRLDLVRAARLTDDTFEPRDDVDLTTRRSGAFSVMPRHTEWARVSFPPDKRRSLEEQGLEIRDMQDGRIEARIPYLDERWLVRETLRHAGGAVVIAPEAVRSRIVEETRAIRALYE